MKYGKDKAFSLYLPSLSVFASAAINSESVSHAADHLLLLSAILSS